MRFRFRASYRDKQENSNFSLDMKTAEAFRIADKIVVMQDHLSNLAYDWDRPEKVTICFDGKDRHDFTEADFERIAGFLRESRPEILLKVIARIYEKNGLGILRSLFPGFYIYNVHSWTDKEPHNHFDDGRILLMAKTSPWVTGYMAADHVLEGNELCFTEHFERCGIKFTHCDWYTLAAET